jgi:hypothetical protein
MDEDLLTTSTHPPLVKARELGATKASRAINWTWASGFTKPNAEEFIRWLDANRYEHRGIYGDAVRFR